MTRFTQRTAACATLALALVLSACGGKGDEGDKAAKQPVVTQGQETIEAVSLKSGPQPITAAETAWLGHVKAYARRLERDVSTGGLVTQASMRRSVRLDRRCDSVSGDAGDAGRLEPARATAEKACARLRKAARLLGQAIAASGPGGVVETSAYERFNRAYGDALEATGNAQRDLQRAVAQAERIAAGLES